MKDYKKRAKEFFKLNHKVGEVMDLLQLPSEERPFIELINQGVKLKRLRQKMGATTTEMAEALGLSGKNAAREYRKYEKGKKNLTGPIKSVLNYIQDSFKTTDGKTYTLTEYTIATGFSQGFTFEYVHRNIYPRFIAAYKPHDVQIRDYYGKPITSYRDINNFKIIFIDKPIVKEKLGDYIEKALLFFEDYKMNNLE